MRWLLGQLPSIGLSLWALLVFKLVGDKRRVGWMLGVIGEVAWLPYAIWIRQYGLMLACAIYGGVYLRNWFKWG